jgi:hypothetical protein
MFLGDGVLCRPRGSDGLPMARQSD